MPLTVRTLWGSSPASTIACFRAASTPKSPQPGHQSGSTLPFRSLIVTLTRSVSTTVAIVVSLNLNLVHGHVEFRGACQDRLDAVRDVVGHERLAVVLPDVTGGGEAGLRSQIARELAAVVVLDDDDLAAPGQDRLDRLGVQRAQPTDLSI